jgi:hypothetical protein
LIGLSLIGDNGGGPIFVRDAEKSAGGVVPNLADRVRAGDGAFLGDVGVGEFLQALVAENPD